jgi:hypothetical protein
MAKRKKLIMALRLSESVPFTFANQDQAKQFHDLVKRGIVRAYKKVIGFPPEVDIPNFNAIGAQLLGLVPVRLDEINYDQIEVPAEDYISLSGSEGYFQEFLMDEFDSIVATKTKAIEAEETSNNNPQIEPEKLQTSEVAETSETIPTVDHHGKGRGNRTSEGGTETGS